MAATIEMADLVLTLRHIQGNTSACMCNLVYMGNYMLKL